VNLTFANQSVLRETIMNIVLRERDHLGSVYSVEREITWDLFVAAAVVVAVAEMLLLLLSSLLSLLSQSILLG
jgi:hypothetical protein